MECRRLAGAFVEGRKRSTGSSRGDFYDVNFEADQRLPDGSHEVLAIAGGKFGHNTTRMKVLFLIMDGYIIGGQVLEGTGFPPCLTPEHRSSSSF